MTRQVAPSWSRRMSVPTWPVLANLREGGRPQVHNAPQRAARCSHFLAHALPKEFSNGLADRFEAPIRA